jgi:hypothetical protein
MRKLIFILIIFLLGNKLFAQEIICNIPDSCLNYDKLQVLKDWKASGTDIFKGTDTVLNITINVAELGIFPQYDIDYIPTEHYPTDSINIFLNKYLPKGDTILILYFPEGYYIIGEPIALTGRMMIKGAGANKTFFDYNLSGDYTHSCVKMTGSHNGVEDLYIYDDTSYGIITFIPYIKEDTLVLYFAGVSHLDVKIYANDAQGEVLFDGEAERHYTKGIVQCSALLNPGSYFIEVVYYNYFLEFPQKHTLKVEEGKKQAQQEISNLDYPSLKSTIDIKSYPDKYYQNTISIYADYSWVRGIVSYLTRAKHVYLCGAEHNTISGSYFERSRRYSGGKAYGVCTSCAGSNSNRVEDNVFHYLRHAMVMQFESRRNVFAYNSSFGTYATDGGVPYTWSGDLILHGGNTITGPTLNLIEGNIAHRFEVHDQKDIKNGPFNTFFRNRAINHFRISSVPDSLQENQYAQNVIGSKMSPFGDTWEYLDSYGYTSYYNEDGNGWELLPAEQSSYYLEEKPAFFTGGFDWPFVPSESNVNPARDRWNTYGKSKGTGLTVFQGWNDYKGICAPPVANFYNYEWNNTKETYLDNDELIIANSLVNKKNILEFKALNKVRITDGTIIKAGNYVHITVGDFCDGKSFFSMDNTTTYSYSLEKKKDVERTVIPENKIVLFPNPNTGKFSIKGIENIQKNNIQIYDTFGNTLDFVFANGSIVVNNYKGLVLVEIIINKEKQNFKILII